MATGGKVKIEVDYIGHTLGVAPQTDIANAFDAKFDQVIVLGDSRQGGRI